MLHHPDELVFELSLTVTITVAVIGDSASKINAADIHFDVRDKVP